MRGDSGKRSAAIIKLFDKPRLQLPHGDPVIFGGPHFPQNRDFRIPITSRQNAWEAPGSLGTVSAVAGSRITVSRLYSGP